MLTFVKRKFSSSVKKNSKPRCHLTLNVLECFFCVCVSLDCVAFHLKHWNFVVRSKEKFWLFRLKRQKFGSLRVARFLVDHYPVWAETSILLLPFYDCFITLQEFKTALKEDTVDYSTYTANIKRKRPPPSRRGGRSGRMAGRDDEDYDDDEDWGSGVRRPNNSGRKSSRGRQWS